MVVVLPIPAGPRKKVTVSGVSICFDNISTQANERGTYVCVSNRMGRLAWIKCPVCVCVCVCVYTTTRNLLEVDRSTRSILEVYLNFYFCVFWQEESWLLMQSLTTIFACCTVSWNCIPHLYTGVATVAVIYVTWLSCLNTIARKNCDMCQKQSLLDKKTRRAFWFPPMYGTFMPLSSQYR